MYRHILLTTAKGSAPAGSNTTAFPAAAASTRSPAAGHQATQCTGAFPSRQVLAQRPVATYAIENHSTL